MNPEYERQLEAEIDRELKGLTDLAAPPELTSRVMLAIAESKIAARYPQPWQNWPAVLRSATLILLLAVFGGACALVWQLPEFAEIHLAQQHLTLWFAPIEALWQALRVLGGTLISTVGYLGTGVLVVWAFAAAAAYAICIGFGAAIFRCAHVRQ